MTTKEKAEWVLEQPDTKENEFAKSIAFRYLQLIREIRNMLYTTEDTDDKPHTPEHHPV